MSNIPVSRRKQSSFEVEHTLLLLRDEITKLCLLEFGYSEPKRELEKNKFLEACNHLDYSQVQQLSRKYDYRANKFYSMFIFEEQSKILDYVRELTREFILGNSIYPSGPSLVMDFVNRRKHLGNAIGLCFTLEKEIDYVIRILPVDKNRSKPFARLIDKEIALLKGVKKSDLRFLKGIDFSKEDLTTKITKSIQDIIMNFDDLAEDACSKEVDLAAEASGFVPVFSEEGYVERKDRLVKRPAKTENLQSYSKAKELENGVLQPYSKIVCKS